MRWVSNRGGDERSGEEHGEEVVGVVGGADGGAPEEGVEAQAHARHARAPPQREHGPEQPGAEQPAAQVRGPFSAARGPCAHRNRSAAGHARVTVPGGVAPVTGEINVTGIVQVTNCFCPSSSDTENNFDISKRNSYFQRRWYRRAPQTANTPLSSQRARTSPTIPPRLFSVKFSPATAGNKGNNNGKRGRSLYVYLIVCFFVLFAYVWVNKTGFTKGLETVLK